MFSSADDISIAVVIAGDRKHLSLAVAPIVLTTSRTCSGGASRIDGHRAAAPPPRRFARKRLAKNAAPVKGPARVS